jgi:Kef-type K+ transport system membrane component KefB
LPSNFDLALRLFLQLAVILAACRAFGYLLRYVGQTQVVGEMVAGFVLGPSIFGLIAAGVQRELFPTSLTLAVGDATTTIRHPSMTILYALSQIGVVLYMFLVGSRFNTRYLTRHLRETSQLSLVGIVVPAAAGAALGVIWVDDDRLFPRGVALWQAGLILAAAMSITAFPVLARILHDSGMTQTKVGTLSISAAAIGDLVAWSLLAIVLATSEYSATIALLALGGGAAYAIGMIVIGRPLLRRFDAEAPENGLSMARLASLLLVVMLCAWVTEAVGIHAVFGAFIAGAVMPRGRFLDDVRRAVEPLTVTILVPVFFVYAGLNTRIGLLDELALAAIAVAIIGVAFISKGGGCALAMRLAGGTWREAGSVGALMNARGLMELVLIGIALDKGLISPTLYTILALMAIVTTVAATPLFRRLYEPDKVRVTQFAIESAASRQPAPQADGG